MNEINTGIDPHEWGVFDDAEGSMFDFNFLCNEARETISKIDHYSQDITIILNAREADNENEDDLLYVTRERVSDDLACIGELAEGLAYAVKQVSAAYKARGMQE